ncbi:MAG: hypothetical protein KGM24_14510 [Elusimicrobia bacterium]|nr:hypothetical protein [Elusimicrobiota bacterium]
MKIYELTRKADSPEGKRENLTADKHWGEGHGEITLKGDSKPSIAVNAMISYDSDDSTECDYEITGLSVDKAGRTINSFKNSKLDSCEKSRFGTPFMSGRLETIHHNWITLDFEFQRDSKP